MSFMMYRHILDHLSPMKMIMSLTLTRRHMKENSSKKPRASKNVSEIALHNPRTWNKTMRVNPIPMMRKKPIPMILQEPPEEEEVSAPDDLSMLDRLQKGPPNVCVVEPDDAVIYDDTRDSDDDPSIDPGEETDDPDYC